MTPEQVRAAMPPDMLKACEAVKARFPGMRLLHLETPTLTLGRDVLELRRRTGSAEGGVFGER